MEQTAIDWLKNKLKETYDKEGKLPLAYTLHLIEQAKQMEKLMEKNYICNKCKHGKDMQQM